MYLKVQVALYNAECDLVLSGELVFRILET